MQPDRPLLTVAVPTFNRSVFLAELLRSVVPQVENEPAVEVLISDNASPDDTAAVAKRFCPEGPRFRIVRNAVNIGADANFIQCFEMARGEYVWICGDDDIVLPGALRILLQHLEERKYDLFFLNAVSFFGEYQSRPQPEFSGKIREFASPEDFVLFASAGLTFISCNISRKAAWAEIPIQDFRKLIGTNLAQLGWTYGLLRQGARCAWIPDELVAARQANGGGHGTCQVFGANLRAIVDDYFGLESPTGRAIVNRMVQHFFPWAMLYSRKTEGKNYLPEDAEAILGRLYRNNPRYWFFLYPVLRLPIPLASAWLLVSKVVDRMDRMMGYPLSR